MLETPAGNRFLSNQSMQSPYEGSEMSYHDQNGQAGESDSAFHCRRLGETDASAVLDRCVLVLQSDRMVCAEQMRALKGALV